MTVNDPFIAQLNMIIQMRQAQTFQSKSELLAEIAAMSGATLEGIRGWYKKKDLPGPARQSEIIENIGSSWFSSDAGAPVKEQQDAHPACEVAARSLDGTQIASVDKPTMLSNEEALAQFSAADLAAEIQRREAEAKRRESETVAKQALVQIEEHLKTVRVLIRECQEIADAVGVEFSFGLGYHDLRYYPHLTEAQREQRVAEDEWYESREGWMSSSDMC